MCEKLFRAVVGSLKQGVLIADCQESANKVSFVNEAFTELTGYRSEEIVGKDPALLFDQQLIDIQSKFIQVVKEKKPVSKAIQILTKQGAHLWCQIHISPVMEPDANDSSVLHHLTISFQDISKDFERVRNNKELVQYLGGEEIMLKSVIENVPGVIYQWIENPKNNSFNFIYVSPKIKDIFGIEPNEFHKLIEIIHPDDRESWRRSIDEANASGRTWRYEGRLLYPDGTVKWWQGMSHKVGIENDDIYYNGVLFDITEKKLLELEVERERQHLVQASKMATLGEMATGIAHEINNPLTVIVGLNHELKSNFDRGNLTKEFFKSHCDKIDRSTYRIATIVGSLKDFARDSSREPLVKRDLQVLLNDALEIISPKLANRSIDIRLELPDVPVYLKCRPTQIEQVIVNLVSNAIDAVKELEQRWVTVKVQPMGDSVDVRFTDSGRGIPPDIQAKMMEPFFTTKPLGQGTGLGLSVSDGIIKAHSGSLALDTSSPNTCFVVRLPLAR